MSADLRLKILDKRSGRLVLDVSLSFVRHACHERKGFFEFVDYRLTLYKDNENERVSIMVFGKKNSYFEVLNLDYESFAKKENSVGDFVVIVDDKGLI